jgi:hypothetical protein
MHVWFWFVSVFSKYLNFSEIKIIHYVSLSRVDLKLQDL